MKILETSDTGWIEEMEALIKEMLSLAEYMDRDLGMEDYRKYGAQMRTDAYDAVYGRMYKGDPVGRYHNFIIEFQDRADRVIKQKKEKMG